MYSMVAKAIALTNLSAMWVKVGLLRELNFIPATYLFRLHIALGQPPVARTKVPRAAILTYRSCLQLFAARQPFCRALAFHFGWAENDDSSSFFGQLVV